MPPVHGYVISNGTGSAVRSDLNNALAAIVSNNSSATAPATTYAYMWWADSTTGLLKQRNAANSAWVAIGTLGSTNLGLATLASPTFTGTVTIPAGASISGFAPLASPTFTGTPAAPTASAGTNTTQLATTAFVLANGGSVPAGAVQYFAMSSAPTGYLKANGALLSTTTYAALFAAIGYTFGGSGASFNVPDLRGEFVRGWDDSRGVDTSRTFGSAQADDLKSHTHTYIASNSNNIDKGGGGGQANTGTYTGNTGGTGGTETRPRNIALLACIKF